MSEPKDQTEAACGGSALTAELGADFDDAEERYIHQTLAILRESYEKAAKPYLDRLYAIHARRPPPTILIPAGDTRDVLREWMDPLGIESIEWNDPEEAPKESA